MTLGGTLKNVTIYVKYFWPTLLEIGLLFVLASGHTDTLTTAGNATNNAASRTNSKNIENKNKKCARRRRMVKMEQSIIRIDL